jgi:cytochrome c oxidase cbb3-type subunit 3
MIRFYFAFAAVVLCAIAQTAAAQDLTSGQKLFADNCVRCHGNKGQGGIGLKLAGDAAYWEFSNFRRAVLMGVDDQGKSLKPIMPRFGKVGFTKPKGDVPNDIQLMSIQAYLVTFAPKAAN